MTARLIRRSIPLTTLFFKLHIVLCRNFRVPFHPYGRALEVSSAVCRLVFNGIGLGTARRALTGAS